MPQKLNTFLPYDQASSLLGYLLKWLKTSVHTKTYSLMFVIVLTICFKNMEAKLRRLSVGEWINLWQVQTMKYYSLTLLLILLLFSPEKKRGSKPWKKVHIKYILLSE